MNNTLWKVISIGERRDPTCTHLLTIEFQLIESRLPRFKGGGRGCYIVHITVDSPIVQTPYHYIDLKKNTFGRLNH